VRDAIAVNAVTIAYDIGMCARAAFIAGIDELIEFIILQMGRYPDRYFLPV
jgi:hypothetical protein